MEHDERRRVLVELLDHWGDFFDETAEPKGALEGDDLRELPEDWSMFSSMARWPSVVEMRRCVELLERLGSSRNNVAKVPVHHRHLMAFTARVGWRTVDVAVQRRNAHGKLVDAVERQRVRVVAPWVSARIVESALDVVLGLWDRSVALELPPALTLKLRPLADAEGWTEAA